tara:strand:+ start:523 stop:1113 length:591 start_codon:yes stop_codon:yes gene_type:complete
MKIDDKSKALLQDVLKEASEGKKERIGLLIDKADVAEDIKENFKTLLDEAAPSKEAPNKDILDALKVDGMDDYIKSLMEETKEEATNEANKEKEEANDAVKGILIDSIVSNSVALCKKEINMEDIDGSKEELTKSLGDKSHDELKELSKELHKEVQDALSNRPEETLDSETVSEDPKSEKDRPKSDTEKVITSYFN